jgi:hypothetical protein
MFMSAPDRDLGSSLPSADTGGRHVIVADRCCLNFGERSEKELLGGERL